jgi:hypothetical protein
VLLINGNPRSAERTDLPPSVRARIRRLSVQSHDRSRLCLVGAYRRLDLRESARYWLRIGEFPKSSSTVACRDAKWLCELRDRLGDRFTGRLRGRADLPLGRLPPSSTRAE